MDSVVAVRLSVNAADAVQQMDLQVKPVAYDRDGNTVNGVTFSVDTVTVSYSLNEAKQVPVQVSVTGSPADGYHLGEITCTPKTVSVIGAKEDLDKLNVISLEQIDVSGATSSVSRTFQLSDYLPEGVKLEEGSSSVVQVLVHVDRGEEKTVTVSSDQIHLTNGQDGYQYHLPDSISLVRRMIERGTLTDLVFEHGNVLARVDLDGVSSMETRENLRLFDENYITYERKQGGK